MLTHDPIRAELVAVLVAVTDGCPKVLTVQNGRTLPSGPLQGADRSLQASLRAWVEQQTGQPPGYIEQLYTFADRDRASGSGNDGHVISIGYLGLMREGQAGWRDWYHFLPWEDQRSTSASAALRRTILPAISGWADADARDTDRRRRVAFSFGLFGQSWNEELALHRYELLWEAGLVPEANGGGPAIAGCAMQGDHRRILATAIARLRAKIKYHPVVFELMPPTFTLLQLQRCVEAIAGGISHKQNFRRLIEQQDLVEETGEMAGATGGRPAKLFRFRRRVLDERAVLGTKPSLK